MLVYIWKDPTGTPFYVGLTKHISRTNPKNGKGRNWLCREKLRSIGCDNVVIELRHVETPEQGKELEQQLIREFGRVQLGDGPLTNLNAGGTWATNMSDEGKQRLRELMSDPNHPSKSPEARAKHRERMRDPAVRAKFTGDNNPAKRPEVREKIKAAWANPEFRAARIKEKIGRKVHSDESKATRRQQLLELDDAHPMRTQHMALNTDPKIIEKRVAALRSPESRAKRSAAMKLSWAKRKGVV